MQQIAVAILFLLWSSNLLTTIYTTIFFSISAITTEAALAPIFRSSYHTTERPTLNVHVCVSIPHDFPCIIARTSEQLPWNLRRKQKLKRACRNVLTRDRQSPQGCTTRLTERDWTKDKTRVQKKHDPRCTYAQFQERGYFDMWHNFVRELQPATESVVAGVECASNYVSGA